MLDNASISRVKKMLEVGPSEVSSMVCAVCMLACFGANIPRGHIVHKHGRIYIQHVPIAMLVLLPSP